MLTVITESFDVIGNVLIGLALVYSAVALLACLVGSCWRKISARSYCSVPVTVLKPLCGEEPGLYDSLRSFCDQDHSDYQIVFGANRRDDPALAVARRLQREYPTLDITVVSGCPSIGGNPKVSNLAHMLEQARHERLIIADSDIRVPADYLTRVSRPLDNSQVGLVTCLYCGRPGAGLWSLLGAQYIDNWFRPSVLIAHLFGGQTFSFGATIAMRRETLAAIGGFAAVSDHLADDHRLGVLTQALGLATVISDCVVETTTHEPTLGHLLAHESRWMQTIRSVQPVGYVMAGVTLTLPLALVGLTFTRFDHDSMMAVVAVLSLRLGLELVQSGHRPARRMLALALVPLREIVTACVWYRGLFAGPVAWRNQHYAVARDGSLKSKPFLDKS